MRKHIVCIGDSNTHGYCADPKDCADGGIRFNEDERWTCLLQKGLGDSYLVTEEGLSGRTTVFPDPLYENLDVFSYFWGLLKSHEYIDLLIIMLGTNDSKERFHASPATIAWGMERLCRKAMITDCWVPGTKPNILIVAPPPMDKRVETSCVTDEVGVGAVEKSEKLAAYYEKKAELLGLHFMDAAGCEFNEIDFMHLTKKGHRQLADRFLEKIPQIL
jgi:lysophospholipase L1-like esterase